MGGARRFCLRAGLAAVLIVSAGAPHALAAQQKWASQYVTWKSDGTVSDVTDVDQQIWIVRTNERSYWPMTFGFVGARGGYMGLQYRSADEQRARFAIWNALAAEGPNCRPFDNEGSGHTCYIPLKKIETGTFYRLRLIRLEAAPDGQWWGGYLVSMDKGKLVQQQIGRIKAPPAAKFVNPNSLRNFVEYYGPPVDRCDRVPLSVAAFTPPMMNQTAPGSGTYKGAGIYERSTKAKGNPCESGSEDTGAFISAIPQTFPQGDGVIMFMGATPKQHVWDAKAKQTPKALPAR